LARRALAQELRRKGVDDETARTALDELDPDQEAQAAHDLVRKKARSMRNLDRAVATRRLVGMLARKGYPPGLAYRIVRDELGELEADDPT
jgi:regulatory protein